MGLLIFFVFLAMAVSFTCSVMEATLLSVTPSYIKTLTNKGRRAGVILQEYKKNIDSPLAAILALNTIANTIGATGAGLQAEKVFPGGWVALFVFLFTFSILLFSEIIPKTIGAVYWRKTAPVTAYVLRVITVVLYPLVALSRFVTRKMARSGTANPGIMRDEIFMMAEVGENMGALSDWEEKIIKNILLLERVKVTEILTPRTVMLAFPTSMTVGEVIEKHRIIPFSRIPVYLGDPDDIKGIVLRHDIQEEAVKNHLKTKMKKLIRPVGHVPESISVARLLEKFIKHQTQMFVVCDEYGGTEGIVTLEDALESLLGSEIVDEKDMVIDMRELALKIWNRRMKNRDVSMDEPENREKV